MDITVRKILKENYCTSEHFYTHTSMLPPKGKFQLNRTQIEKFWDAYCNCVEEEKDQKCADALFGITEKPQTYLPVLVDVDLRVRDEFLDTLENKDRLYTDEQLKIVVEVYQSVLRQILDNCTDQDLNCVVLEKKMYQENKHGLTYFKHGFHLHFPIFLDKNEQEIHLIPRVRDALKDLNIFAYLGIEDSGSVIDKACVKNVWLLYGSRKTETAEPYQATKVYNSELKELTIEEAFKNYQIFNEREQLISVKGQVKKYLPRILSIIPFGRSTRNLKRGLLSLSKEKLRKERKASNIQHQGSLEDNLNLLKKLLSLLGIHRTEDRQDWIIVGWAIFNVTNGDPDGLDLWCEFSARCEDKYDENVCVNEWSKFVKKDLGLGTLRYYASIDSPEEYKKFKNERSKEHIVASLAGSHNDIAKALFEEYGDVFVCSSFANRTWYQFVNHIWQNIEEGVYLREKISGAIIGRYIEAIKGLYDALKECEDKAKEEMISDRIKQIHKMIANLKNCNYKNAVMRECAEVFYNEQFKKKLDSNPYIIAFKNGVYDLQNNTFRPGRPEDYLSNSLAINYVEFIEEDERVQNVLTYLEQVFPDKSIRDYFMNVTSELFVGGNFRKQIYFWTGEGDNSKSILVSILDQIFGNLFIKLSTTVLSGKKPCAGSTFADLARAGQGCRGLVMDEPDADEVLGVGLMKQLTGNDRIYARDLFERGKDVKEIKPMFKLIMVTNKLPRVRNADSAVWGRVRVVPFEACFVKPEATIPAPDTYEEQLRQKRFPMDLSFSKKIPSLLEPFAWLLLEHRKKNLPYFEPEKVRQATEAYKRQNDIYKQFIDECIMVDPTSQMSLTELYNLFKDWFRSSIPGSQIPIKGDVEDVFCKLWGFPDAAKRWQGYKQRTFQDKIAAGDIIVIDAVDHGPEKRLLATQMTGAPPI
jgi:P4 family phage/plasmid primase-like protien